MRLATYPTSCNKRSSRAFARASINTSIGGGGGRTSSRKSSSTRVPFSSLTKIGMEEGPCARAGGAESDETDARDEGYNAAEKEDEELCEKEEEPDEEASRGEKDASILPLPFADISDEKALQPSWSVAAKALNDEEEGAKGRLTLGEDVEEANADKEKTREISVGCCIGRTLKQAKTKIRSVNKQNYVVVTYRKNDENESRRFKVWLTPRR